jgi:hypothetical protein
MSCYYHSHLIIPYLAQIWGFWVTCGVKMMSLCHGWGWQPHQTASLIHIRHTQSVWAHWYAVHGHTLSALHSYTHPTWLRFWGSGPFVESKWCHYVMVEADSPIKLLPTSILDIYKLFGHLDMLSMGIQYQPYTVIPTPRGSDFGVLGHLWSQNDVIMSWLRLTATPQTASCIHIRHSQSVWVHWYAVHRHMVAALNIYTHPTWLRFWHSGSLVESTWCHYVMVEADSHLKLLLVPY